MVTLTHVVGALALVATTLLPSSSAAVPSFTEANFEAEVSKSGKGAIVKFYAPWCGHCKRLKPIWDELGEEFADYPSTIIGDVDCTVEKGLCSKFGVSGYPTLMYFNGETGEKGASYQKGRDKKSLTTFIKENLDLGCDVTKLSACEEKEKAYITKMQAKGGEAIASQLVRLEKMSSDPMAPELKTWLLKRINILKQL